MGCQLREALRFVQAVAVTGHFLRHVVIADLDGSGLIETWESLITIEPVSRAAWQALARVVRHLIAACEETGDARVLLLYELRDEVMRWVDATAASERQKGSD